MKGKENEIFALVDCNNFYVSCERVFNPAIDGKAVVVLSNNDGCVIARSNEAKALGIKMGEPAYKCRDLFEKEDIAVYSSNYALYDNMSQRVMDILSKTCPEVEIYSIDEAFLRLGTMSRFDLGTYARDIRQRVKKWTGIPVSIGIGTTRTLAKAANRLAKKDISFNGVCDLHIHNDIDPMLEKIEAGDVWGIGKAYSRKLLLHGISDARKLKYASDDWIRKNMTVGGLRTVWELRGISCIPIKDSLSPRKQIIVSRSFGKQVKQLGELIESITEYASRAGEKLRQQGSCAYRISVFLQTNPFKDSPQYHNIASIDLVTPTCFTPHIVGRACEILRSIYRSGCAYKKTGIILSGIIPEDKIQLGLFETGGASEKQKRLMKATDDINREYGRDSIKLASAGIEQNWKMQSAFRSPCYTTRWEDLPLAWIL